MAPPTQVKITPGVPVDFSISEGSPHVIVYRLWLQDPGSSTWKLIGEGRTDDDTLDHFIITTPIPSGSVFGYSLAVGGTANSPWRAHVAISQAGGPGSGDAWDETGVVSDDGNGLGHEVRSGKVPLA